MTGMKMNFWFSFFFKIAVMSGNNNNNNNKGVIFGFLVSCETAFWFDLFFFFSFLFWLIDFFSPLYTLYGKYLFGYPLCNFLLYKIHVVNISYY